IKKHDYKPLFMLLYSHFLNPIEKYWANIKSNTKLHLLSVNDQLTLRIVTACNTTFVEDCQRWVGHSINFWNYYLYK
ncbi:hypothetical protein BJ944DRAFT_170867, partial [Cunninghamella echinulata]